MFIPTDKLLLCGGREFFNFRSKLCEAKRTICDGIFDLQRVVFLKSKLRMPWSPLQRQRIVLERDILNVYFPNKVTWLHRLGKVEVKMKTNNENEYCLRVYLPEDFPYSVPDMVVAQSPEPMPNWENNGETHTLTRRDGLLRICHFRVSVWSNDNTLYEMFMKGRLWLEAY